MTILRVRVRHVILVANVVPAVSGSNGAWRTCRVEDDIVEVVMCDGELEGMDVVVGDEGEVGGGVGILCGLE